MQKTRHHIAAAVLAAAAMLIAGCGGPPIATPTPTPALTAEDVRDRAADGLRNLSSVHFRITHESGGTDLGFSAVLTEAEGVGLFPDKADFVAEATTALFGDAAIEFDIVQDGETTYLRDRLSMAWQALPPETLSVNFASINASIADALASLDELGLADGGSIDGAPVHLLTGVTSASSLRGLVPGAADNATLRVEVWAGRADYLVRKARLTGVLLPADTPDITRILELSRFDEPVTIEPPI